MGDEMTITIGETTITTIVEQPLHGLNHLIPLARREAIREISWLSPDYALADGTMFGLIQTFVVEHRGTTVVVDTCIGDGKNLPTDAAWCNLTTGFLDRFRTAGFDPDRVDIVLCTHLHLDHVGWNTRLDGDRWVPTFPNARYVFDRTEYDYWLAEANPCEPPVKQPFKPPFKQPFKQPGETPVEPIGELVDERRQRALAWAETQVNVQVESIQPVVEAGLAHFVVAPHELLPGLRLIPTVGHTPGHVSVEIISAGERALITGDSFHHPCQIAHPEWSTRVDFDRAASSATRQSLLDALVADNGVMIGSHFAPPGHGRIVHTEHGHRLCSAPTVGDDPSMNVLDEPPR